MSILQKVRNLLRFLWSMSVLVSLAIAFFSAAIAAQQPKINYVYDDLGRLVRVIDENGNAATYHYDAVGNLLRITRESGVPATAAVSVVSPSSWNRGTNTTVTIAGHNLFCSSVSAILPG